MFTKAYESKYGKDKRTLQSFGESNLDSVIKKAGDDPEDQLKAIFEHTVKDGKRSRIYSVANHLDMLTAQGPEALVKARTAVMESPKKSNENSISAFKELKNKYAELSKPEKIIALDNPQEDIGKGYNRQ